MKNLVAFFNLYFHRLTFFVDKESNQTALLCYIESLSRLWKLGWYLSFYLYVTPVYRIEPTELTT